MGRINGINSDYIRQGDQIVEVSPQPANLEMKLFICPYQQDNALESEGNVCVGTDSDCPSGGASSGHALVHLSQSDGIQLATDGGTRLQLHQNSGPGAGDIDLAPASGTVKIEAGGQVLTITPSASGVSIQHANGAEVVFQPNGDLDLITKNNTGTVNIEGNLVVSGSLSRQGQPI